MLGYLIAVAAGAVLLSAVRYFEDAGALTVDLKAAGAAIWNTASVIFFMGLVFGLPYTIFGALLFRFVLPRNWITFMVVGTLCPTFAIFTLDLASGNFLWEAGKLELLLMTLPAGLVATYLFGAIGFGQGFRRWRFA